MVNIWATELTEPQQASLQEIVLAAQAADDISPLNEQGHRSLNTQTDAEWLIAVAEDGEIQGFAQVRNTQLGTASNGHPEAQLVVHPRARNLGVGEGLVRVLKDRFPHGAVWTFGVLPAAATLAAKFDMPLARELLIMERDLTLHPAIPEQPDASLQLVGYRDQDAEELVAINALAFAHHPEQGAMSIEDVRLKTSEPGFDPEGLILARDASDGRLLGFHWTKMHGAREDRPGGEVYVIGVHPDASGRGIGRVLLAQGLTHLQNQGAPRVHLYVEAASQRAVTMYKSASFDVVARDGQYTW